MATSHTHSRRPAGAGWFTFAGVMFALAGVSNLLWGIGALDDKKYLPKDGLIVNHLHAWGWVSIIWGLMALAGAFLLLTRNPWSAGVGLVLATLNAVFWLFALPVLPIWSLVVITIDVLIVYHLAIHSDVVDT
jgi:hypothetical protein